MKIAYIIPFLITLFFGCKLNSSKQNSQNDLPYKEKVFTAYSNHNHSLNFNASKAINRLADIENEYFNALAQKNTYSKYYGTEWRKWTELNLTNDYQDYIQNIETNADSMHCTLYAYEALKYGFNENQFKLLKKLHKEIWKEREIAGWSLGYLLVKHFGWKAYLIIDKNSKEYHHCLKAYQKNKKYPVWKQPHIPLEAMYIIGKQDSLINNLLNKHQFGWGFSEQGFHTWVTRYTDLKECYWYGVPAQKYTLNSGFTKPLFLKTPLLDFHDYQSHVIIFPENID